PQDDDVLQPFEVCRKPTALRSEHTGRMSLIDQQEGFVFVRKRAEGIERRPIAIHAVEAFDSYPDAALSAFAAPCADGILEGGRIVMRCRCVFGASEPHAL